MSNSVVFMLNPHWTNVKSANIFVTYLTCHKQLYLADGTSNVLPTATPPAQLLMVHNVIRKCKYIKSASDVLADSTEFWSNF